MLAAVISLVNIKNAFYDSSFSIYRQKSSLNS